MDEAQEHGGQAKRSKKRSGRREKERQARRANAAAREQEANCGPSDAAFGDGFGGAHSKQVWAEGTLSQSTMHISKLDICALACPSWLYLSCCCCLSLSIEGCMRMSFKRVACRAMIAESHFLQMSTPKSQSRSAQGVSGVGGGGVAQRTWRLNQLILHQSLLLTLRPKISPIMCKRVQTRTRAPSRVPPQPRCVVPDVQLITRSQLHLRSMPGHCLQCYLACLLLSTSLYLVA